VQTTSQNLGEPAVQETRFFDAEGREVLEGGRTVGAGRGQVGRIEGVEEVGDEDLRNE